MNRSDEAKTLVFETYGVRFAITSRLADVLVELEGRLRSAFPPGELAVVRSIRNARRFSIRSNRRNRYALFAGRTKVTAGNDLNVFLNFLQGRLRLFVAEHAPDFVFVHAGVVGWKGKAVLVPGRSHSGKTSLIKTLGESGAQYYSDEFAIIGRDGLIRPFASELAVRDPTGGGEQVGVAIEELGGVRGDDPIPVGLIVFTEFEPKGRFVPTPMTTGEGILELLSHTIPMTYRPEFSLKLLNLAASRAIILKSKRGEAAIATRKILKLLEKQMS